MFSRITRHKRWVRRLDSLKKYAKVEQGRAEAYAKEAERTGDTNQTIAWNHTAMAYADIICEIEKAHN